MMGFLSKWETALKDCIGDALAEKHALRDTKDAAATKCDGCGYLGIDGGPGPVMVCNHPDSGDYGYIVHWDRQGKNRISGECPK